MKKLLLSPLGVIFLCLTALSMLFFNIIKPLLPVRPQSNSPVMTTIPSPPAVDLSVENTVPGHALQKLAAIGWKRQVGRNPFVNKARVGGEPEWLSEPVPVSAPPVPAPPPIAPPPSEGRHLLQAIMIGPEGKSAQILTKTVVEGDVLKKIGKVIKIEPDFVVIEGPNGKRVLHLEKNKPEVSP
ncbi:MAG: hypothetical protein A2293_05875 [Elusimicrobia bacterium RIFOXYB2_FULL_49_7]|nr:MAG: hypothetical protein A2293_05875 [Elusimicrobia bacterium RIFOXYB2_FULL_49_7]